MGLGNRTSDDPQADPDGEQQFLSCSQKDVQTLEDLVELAGEGLTLTQWNIDVDHTGAVKQLSKFWQPCELIPSNHIS